MYLNKNGIPYLTKNFLEEMREREIAKRKRCYTATVSTPEKTTTSRQERGQNDTLTISSKTG
jgi:hypothetical protein